MKEGIRMLIKEKISGVSYISYMEAIVLTPLPSYDEQTVQ